MRIISANSLGARVLATILALVVATYGNNRQCSIDLGAERAAGARVPSPKVVDWKEDLAIPDDVLFVRHRSGPQSPIVLVMSLNSVGEVDRVRQISGFSLYLDFASDQIKSFHFPSGLNGETFVLRIPDPLQRFIADSKLHHEGVCTPESDLRTLYKLGVLFWRAKDNDAAINCYRYILDRKPDSVAARYGMADILLSKKDPAANSYLESLLHSNPQFIEARQRLIALKTPMTNAQSYVYELDEALQTQLSMVDRQSILGDQVFVLDRAGLIQQALKIIPKWNDATYELLALFAPSVSTNYIQANHFGLLEEASGMYQDALDTYQLASDIMRQSSTAPELSRYQADLGAARILKRTGKLDDAANLCTIWKTRSKRLISAPVHHRWELRQEGEPEIRGRWEFSCGDPKLGLDLILGAIKKYPQSDVAYSALAEYYYSTGDLQRGREAEQTAGRLLEDWGKRLGQFNR